LKFLIVIFAYSCLLLIPLSEGKTQILESGTSEQTGTFSNRAGAYYNFSSGSGCDLQVSVWNWVVNPGRYNVPCETNLFELLSFCGGPKRGAYLDKIKIVRRGGPNRENELKEVMEIDIEKYLELTDVGVTADELLLYPGDLIIIDGEAEDTVDTFLRAAQVIVAITSLVTATVAVINLTK